MGVFDVSEGPPIPHPRSYWDGLPRPRPVKSHRSVVQHSRFFPALVTSAEESRNLTGPASFLLLCRALSNCSPRTAPIWSVCSAASAARGRPLLAFLRYNSHTSQDLAFKSCRLCPPRRHHDQTDGRCSISLLPIGNWPQVAPLTDQSPCIVGIGLWHALWGVTSTVFIFYCLFACLSYLSAGTHYDRL